MNAGIQGASGTAETGPTPVVYAKVVMSTVLEFVVVFSEPATAAATNNRPPSGLSVCPLA